MGHMYICKKMETVFPQSSFEEGDSIYWRGRELRQSDISGISLSVKGKNLHSHPVREKRERKKEGRVDFGGMSC